MTQLTIALILFLAPLAYSPGPGNMFFAANGARFGFRATVPANLGYHAATLVVTIGIGLGFDWISREAPMFLAFSLYAALGEGMTARWRSPDTARFLNLSFAAILAGVAIWMLLA
ncbi:hypothetical protein LGQ03_08600 [Loktanella sp. TSTF-M6]|uniref:LysE type translocator n=1 Tax=Loktanella gaetbuli TaxID=2881335 RepID=A0ABS8BU81_9RHOB|nr:hypothetical protein [Loktanella gaetbuli]MCB5199299.1 hypothetical protein [Loktanella gaetbuli]